MEATITEKIMTFFDNIDDMLNNYVDKVELTPVQITSTAYITGFKRSLSNFISLDVHIKEIRKVKLEGIHTSITDDGGWYMMEPDGEVWVNSMMLSEKALETALQQFTKKMGELKSFHLMLSKWKDDGDNFNHVEVALFENKRVACKEALKMRKKHQNVSNKFEMYNNQGELVEYNAETQEHEPTDFELVTCKID